jgi:hypothetical protein
VLGDPGPVARWAREAYAAAARGEDECHQRWLTPVAPPAPRGRRAPAASASPTPSRA